MTDSDGTSMLWWDLNGMNLLYDGADNATGFRGHNIELVLDKRGGAR